MVGLTQSDLSKMAFVILAGNRCYGDWYRNFFFSDNTGFYVRQVKFTADLKTSKEPGSSIDRGYIWLRQKEILPWIHWTGLVIGHFVGQFSHFSQDINCPLAVGDIHSSHLCRVDWAEITWQQVIPDCTAQNHCLFYIKWPQQNFCFC